MADVMKLVPQAVELRLLGVVEHQPREMMVFAIKSVSVTTSSTGTIFV